MNGPLVLMLITFRNHRRVAAELAEVRRRKAELLARLNEKRRIVSFKYRQIGVPSQARDETQVLT